MNAANLYEFKKNFKFLHNYYWELLCCCSISFLNTHIIIYALKRIDNIIFSQKESIKLNDSEDRLDKVLKSFEMANKLLHSFHTDIKIDNSTAPTYNKFMWHWIKALEYKKCSEENLNIFIDNIKNENLDNKELIESINKSLCEMLMQIQEAYAKGGRSFFLTVEEHYSCWMFEKENFKIGSWRYGDKIE